MDGNWIDPQGEGQPTPPDVEAAESPTAPQPLTPAESPDDWEPTGAWASPGGWGQPGAAGVPSSESSRPRGRAAIAAIVAALVLLSAGIGIGLAINGHHNAALTATEAPLRPGPQTGSSSGTLDLQSIANKVDPAIVDINTVIDAIAGQPATARAAGTGMVVTASGEVLTNNHVIAGATSIRVTFQGRPGTYDATVIGADPTDDVALLQVGGVSGAPTVGLADSSSLSVGQKVAAIGNALGLGGTPRITAGTVSALNQTISVRGDTGRVEQLTNLIQTDAHISPGDSGGPLVNASGQVVGMITAGSRSQSQTEAALAFAIPVNDAVDIVNQIREGKASSKIILGQPGFLGVAVQGLDARTATQLGVSSGALVIEVVPGTPAAHAGMQVGAVITSVGGRKIGTAGELGPAIYVHKPGERVEVVWVDASGVHSAVVSLIAGPAV
jgi:S1-C subfamily serine protease